MAPKGEKKEDFLPLLQKLFPASNSTPEEEKLEEEEEEKEEEEEGRKTTSREWQSK